jgi:hypothetical protein
VSLTHFPALSEGRALRSRGVGTSLGEFHPAAGGRSPSLVFGIEIGTKGRGIAREQAQNL